MSSLQHELKEGLLGHKQVKLMSVYIIVISVVPSVLLYISHILIYDYIMPFC